MQKYLDKQGIKWRTVDKDLTGEVGWFSKPKAAALVIGLPALLVCSEDFSNVIAAEKLPATLAEAVELIKRHEKKREASR